ncbi:hypothetical protein FIBSPDRAFT_877153 [Athelia psychrophila]|uniref:Secreted protein n=1 Tax=Athelia psychrophila TaxID=1759441 RepID=A0A167W897_9AGAM|nr:hypothetical protein FIBSPDRAFT_877153 [Fibularhizoctonia sp. CBS 109695]
MTHCIGFLALLLLLLYQGKAGSSSCRQTDLNRRDGPQLCPQGAVQGLPGSRRRRGRRSVIARRMRRCRRDVS